MSFLYTAYGRASPKERFSLLSLSPDEIYFKDFSVLYISPDQKVENAVPMKGRLKICSQSLVFDCKTFSVPVIKISLDSVEQIGLLSDNWTKKKGYDGRAIGVNSKLVIEMSENNIIAPYKFRESDVARCHVFVLTHSDPDDCLPLVCQLRRAALARVDGDVSDGKFMVLAIVHSIQARMSFDLSLMEDVFETPVLQMDGVRIGPLVKNPGKILLTQTRLYFQAFNNIEPAQLVVKVKLTDVKSVRRRRFLMRHVGLEIACSGRSSSPKLLFLQLENMACRDKLCTEIASRTSASVDGNDERNMLLKWQNGTIGNYEYLKYLNSVADRSFNDLTQYPVFPWVVADYTSAKLDLMKESTFRDLSKPIGALNPKRLTLLKERYDDMPEPKFLFGSHYSTPGDVLFFLSRAAPEYTLCLHNGRFDQPDRMFRSVHDTWQNVQSSTSDFKELIPEFYQSRTLDDGREPGFFLDNRLNIDFGFTQDGEPIQNVTLPPWANSSGDFVCKLREALECAYVSERLHLWIDLIFGYKQRGEEAVMADNVFYYLTYEGAVDIDDLSDEKERSSIEAQILEFGQTPRQLFFTPHPARFPPKGAPCEPHAPPSLLPHLSLSSSSSSSSSLSTAAASYPTKISPSYFDELKSFYDISTPAHMHTEVGRTAQFARGASANTDQEQYNEAPSIPSGVSGNQILLPSLNELKEITQHNLHKRAVVNQACFSVDGTSVLSVSEDCSLKIYSLEQQCQTRSVMTSMGLSSVCVLPDGQTVIMGCWDNYIYFYNLEYGRILHSVLAHDDAITGLVWHRDRLVTCSLDATVKIWRCGEQTLEQGPELLCEIDHDMSVTAVRLNQTITQLAVGMADGSIRLRDVDTIQITHYLPAHSNGIGGLTFSSDGRRLVSCGGEVMLCDVVSGSLIESMKAEQDIGCIVSDDRHIVGGGDGGSMYGWDLLNPGSCTVYDAAHKDAIKSISIGLITTSQPVTSLVTCSADGSVKVFA